MRSRRTKGTSLVETLVIIVIGGVIATLSIKLLHQSQLSARQADQWLQLQTGMTHLETQLRQDLRAATEVDLPDEQSLAIQIPDGSVLYVAKEGLVERKLTEKDSDMPRLEGYRLPKCRVVITKTEDGQVNVRIKANPTLPSTEEYVIEQTIGRRP